MFLMTPAAYFLNYVDLIRDDVGPWLSRFCDPAVWKAKAPREVWVSLASGHRNLPRAREGRRGTQRRKACLRLLLIGLGTTLALRAQSWQAQREQHGVWVKEGFGVKAPRGFNPCPLFISLVSLTLRLFRATWTLNGETLKG